MLNNRLILGNKIMGEKIQREIQFYPDFTPEGNKCQELADFGFSGALITKWIKRNNINEFGELGIPITQCLNTCEPIMQRLKTQVFGIHSLGLYIHSIRKIIQERFTQGTIVDFGCSGWVDIDIALVKDTQLKVQLIDVIPLPLAFASYQLQRRGIKHHTTIPESIRQELDLIDKDVVMIIESTSFEHIPNLEKIFKPLIKKLPSGGFFLTNYTKLDWSLPMFDGYQENKDYSKEAVEFMMEIAYRYQWIPEQVKYTGWDLWEIK